MRICLVADKPSLAINVMPHIRDLHPDLESCRFVFAQVHPIYHLNPDFRLPRGLSWRDYPFSGEPDYRPFRFGYESFRGRSLGLRFGADDKVFPEDGPTPWMKWGHDAVEGDPEQEALRRFREADVIYAALDATPSDWLALDRCLKHLDLPSKCDVRIPWIDSMSSEALAAAFAAPHRPGDARYEAMTCQARIRRRFDYGYLANALPVHGRTLRLAGAPDGAPVPSKYALQTLYDLHRNGPASEGKLLARMQGWRGTGRYAPTCDGYRAGIGSAASRSSIIKTLVQAGLADDSDIKRVDITDLGRRFLERLHPDSEDRDLPFRLREWARLPEADANQRVDRYLRTFFGKQVRYLARAEPSAPLCPIAV